MRVVVTGATGLTGGAVVRELLARGHQVVGVTRSASREARVAALGARPAVADCARPGAMESHLAAAEGLVHVAGIGFGEALATSPLARLRRVVVVSTASVYSRHHGSRTLYERNEAALRSAAPDALLVRPTMVYGSPRDRNVHHVIAFAKRWRALPLPDDGHALIQPIHYADLAAAIAALFDASATGIVDAGGPGALALRDAAGTIMKSLGLQPRLVPIPVGAALPFARAFDAIAGSRWAERLERTREDRVVSNARLIGLTSAELRTFEAGISDEVVSMTLGERG